MAEQLDLFGIWHVVVREPLPQPGPAPEPVVEPVPVLPGQQGLFAGAHVGEAAVDAALAAFDAGALRAAYEKTRAEYPRHRPARDWPRWADGLAALTAGSAAEQLERAESLGNPEVGLDLFPRWPRTGSRAWRKRPSCARSACCSRPKVPALETVAATSSRACSSAQAISPKRRRTWKTT